MVSFLECLKKITNDNLRQTSEKLWPLKKDLWQKANSLKTIISDKRGSYRIVKLEENI